jgi:C-terminal processing protease CtpA/Prc
MLDESAAPISPFLRRELGLVEFRRALGRGRHSGLDVILSQSAFVRSDGTLLDGRGVMPDVVVEPDADYYVGKQDRMLEKAIDVLKGKIELRK